MKITNCYILLSVTISTAQVFNSLIHSSLCYLSQPPCDQLPMTCSVRHADGFSLKQETTQHKVRVTQMEQGLCVCCKADQHLLR